MPSSGSNPALEVILADYQRFHAVLVVLAAVFLVATVTLLVACVRSLRAARRSPSGATRRQVWTYRIFITGSILVTLFLLVVIAANLSTALNPARGFAGVDQSGRAITAWLSSGSPVVPAEVQDRVDARLAWQRPKAIVVTLLLVAVVSASVWVWRRWISRAYPSRLANVTLLLTGIVSTGAALLLMLMVMGNVQAVLAPTTMSLVLG